MSAQEYTDDSNKKKQIKYFSKWERDLIISIAAIIGITMFAISLKYFFAPKFKAVLLILQDTPNAIARTSTSNQKK